MSLPDCPRVAVPGGRFDVTTIVHVQQIPDELAGQRLDQALSRMFPDYSRSRLTQWLKAGRIRVDGETGRRPRERMLGGEQVEIRAETDVAPEVRPQAIELDVVWQDADLIVIDKPAGMVVHPAAGNPDGTLQNALLHHDPSLAALPRAGIVHRLDKDTTGLMVVARSPGAHKSLVGQLQARSVKREYQAVLQGVLTGGGTVDAPIGRHPVDRKRMAVAPPGMGKEAISHYRVLDRFRAHSHVRVNLETGRTHQIRVHMAHIRHPLVGDPVYGGRPRLPPACADELARLLRGFGRQALHAARLSLIHPRSGEIMQWASELPDDMQTLIARLRQDAAQHLVEEDDMDWWLDEVPDEDAGLD